MALGMVSRGHAADDLDRQQKALTIISDFASKLCQDISLSRETSSLELSASAKAGLKGVAKKVADLGFDAAAKYGNSREEGLLQQDLAKALADSRNCRVKVWDDLKGKLLASGSAAALPPLPKTERPPLPKVTPDAIVEDRIREILRAKRDADEIDLKPALMTSAETRATLEKVNRETLIYDTTVNLHILHRFIRDSGKPATRSALAERVNVYADKNARLVDYLSALVGRFQGDERLNNVDDVNDIYREAVLRLNERAAARSELYTFIANLKHADFIGKR